MGSSLVTSSPVVSKSNQIYLKFLLSIIVVCSVIKFSLPKRHSRESGNPYFVVLVWIPVAKLETGMT